MASLSDRPTDDQTQVLFGNKLYRTQLSSDGESHELLEKAVIVTTLSSKDLEMVRAGTSNTLENPEFGVKWSTELVCPITCIR